jgi:Cys-tRNA(Pro) deacylase
MLADTDLRYEVTRTKPAGSIGEAALLRGVPVDSILKTLVVRRGEGDHVFVVLAGDRVIDWPKLREALGVRRLSLPDAEEAKAVTGYERGAITPFGAATELPVIIDAPISAKGDVSIGGGAHGVSVRIDATTLIDAVHATVVDVSKPAD